MAGPTETVLIDGDLAQKLKRHELDIAKLQRQGKDVLFRLSYELYMARNTCLEHRNEGAFGPWVEDLGISRSGAYRAISRWENIAPKVVDCPNVGQIPSFEGFLCFAKFDDSALDELARPSTPKKALNRAIKIAQAGKGMTRQEALELIAKHSEDTRCGPGRDPSGVERGRRQGETGQSQHPQGNADVSAGGEGGSSAPAGAGTSGEDASTEALGTEQPEETSSRPPRNGKDKPKITAKTGRAKEVWEAQQVLKGWADAVGRWMNGNPAGIDVYRERFPGKAGDRVIEAAKEFFNALEAWKKGLK